VTQSTTMRKVLLYDPAISSLNMGDHIISESCHRELGPLLDKTFLVEISSHLPISKYLSYLGNVDYRFVCGSNLLRGRMNSRFRQWDVTPLHARFVGPAVLMGVGWWQYADHPNAYTRWLYGRILSADLKHSVRDELTAKYLRSMGFDNVINTSCPTMWRLDEDHCAGIRSDQAASVVTTVTDYSRDPVRDRAMLLALHRSYACVHLWLQGSGDLDYLNTLDLPWHKFEILAPALTALDAVLDDPDVEYVGTRLHAGIRALQRGRRSLVVGVDNRAAEKNRDFNLSWLPREAIDRLPDMVRNPLKMDIRIPLDRISEWKGQFPELHANGTRESS
jgi:polysaccharide pyruvyl transferase WcaK-like protein